MDSQTLWSNVDSAFGSVAFDPEDLAGLTVQKRESWEDEEDWDEDEEEEELGWDEDEDEDDDLLDEDDGDDDDDDWDG